MNMMEYKINAKFRDFKLPPAAFHKGDAVVVPTVRGNPFLRYGNHLYYFMDFETLQGIEVKIGHLPIMKIGLKRFFKAHYKKEKHIYKIKYLWQKYHYGLSLAEQLFITNAPHTVTVLGKGQYAISLWAYFGYLLVDCNTRTVTYRVLKEQDDDHVMGTHQWYDPDTEETYYMTYSLKDSLKRCIDPYNPVNGKILKYSKRTDVTAVLWQGRHTDYLHDIDVNKTRQYCVVPEFGLFLDHEGQLILSKALVLDLHHDKQWVIDGLRTGAHAKFDPVESDIVYFSNHNFKLVHLNLFEYLKKGSYQVSFFGPGSISKYRLTADGPELLGSFTHPDLYRVFDHKIFLHRGRKVIALIGFPNSIFIVDADNLSLIKIITVHHERSIKHLYRDMACAVGTISPSNDGEKVYVQTRYSFQVIDIDSSKPDWIRNYFFSHSCTNHMITCQPVSR